MKYVLCLLFTAVVFCAAAQKEKPGLLVKSYDTGSDPVSFTLSRSGMEKQVRRHHDLKVYFERKTRMANGREYLLKYHVRGANLGIEGDSLAIASPQVYIHDEYKRNTDSIYDYFKNTKSGISKMSVNNISKICYERSQLKKTTAGIAALSLVAAFVVAPVTSLEDGKLDLEKFRTINRPALGVFVGAVAVHIVFSHKRFRLKADPPGKNTWTLTKN